MNMLLTRLPRLRAAGTLPKDGFCGSLHIDEGYDQMMASYQAASQLVLPNPAPAEVYCHTLTDPSILSRELNEAGYHTLTLFGLDVPYRLFTEEHDIRIGEIRRRYLAGLNRICSEPFEDCIARDSSGQLCVEIKSPQDLEREIDLDLGNIFHNTLTWFFTDDPASVGRWGVETSDANVFLCGSSAQRGGAVSGIPGHNAAAAVLEQIQKRS